MFEEEFDKHRDDCKNNKCVCKQVKKIAEAQDAVAGTGDCDVSCKQSIRDLVSPTTTSGNDTIPFILYCKCKPFIGSGVIQGTTGQGNQMRPAFTCVQTPIYRVKKVDKNCCATLELLLPVSMGGSTPGPREKTVCSYFPGEAIAAFQRTGVCIKVDLCDFTAISCLDPVRARPVSELKVNSVSPASSKED